MSAPDCVSNADCDAKGSSEYAEQVSVAAWGRSVNSLVSDVLPPFARLYAIPAGFRRESAFVFAGKGKPMLLVDRFRWEPPRSI